MLPHIQNVKAGAGRFDPMISSVFRVQFLLPEMVKSVIGDDDELILSEQVTDITGLDALQKTVAAGQQKFLGVDVSFLNPVLDNTYAELTVNLNLNLRSVTDAYVLRVFKLWSKAGYDILSGARTLKNQYCGSMIVYEANRNGIVWRKASFYDVMLTGVTGIDGLDYTQNEARKLTCTFRSDYWDEEIGGGTSIAPDYNFTLKKWDDTDEQFSNSEFKPSNDVNNTGWAQSW